jgi:hypothetical protein
VIALATDAETLAAIRRINTEMQGGEKARSGDRAIVDRMARQAGWGMPAKAKRALRGELGEDE